MATRWSVVLLLPSKDQQSYLSRLGYQKYRRISTRLLGYFSIQNAGVPVSFFKRTNLESINSRRGPQTEVPISRHLAIEHFQIDNVSQSWAAGDFRHPAGGEVPSAWTRLDLIDSRFVRFRTRSDRTEFFMKQIFKNGKVRAISQS